MNLLLDVQVGISGPWLLIFPPLSILKSALHLTTMRNVMHKSFEDFYFYIWRFCLELDSWAKWIVLFTSYSNAKHTSTSKGTPDCTYLVDGLLILTLVFLWPAIGFPAADGGSWEVGRWRGMYKEAWERLRYWTACNNEVPSNQILSLARNSLESLICLVEIKKQFQSFTETIRPQA